MAAASYCQFEHMNIVGRLVLTEHVGLREATKDGNLVTKYLTWWPGDTSRSRVDTVHDYR